MAQFTVYRNKSARSKALFPFLVDVQSDLLHELQTRVVVPLTKTAALARKPVDHLMPLVTFEGERFLFCAPQLAGMRRADLGAVAGQLTNERGAMLSAVDFLLTGI